MNIANGDILLAQAQCYQQVQTGERRRPGPTGRQPDLTDILVDNSKRAVNRRSNADGGPMLIIMKNRDIHALPAQLFHDKAFRRLDIFQIYAAKCRLHCRNYINKFFRVCLRQLNIKHIDPGKFFEQDRFSFHNRFRGQRTDRPETENGGSVGHHPHQIAARRQLRRLIWIFRDRQTGMGDTGRIGHGQICLRIHGLGWRDRQFSRFWKPVIIHRLLKNILRHTQPLRPY